jgi:hypothetical protein
MSNNLSEHFTLKELIDSDEAVRMGIDNTPTDLIIENLKRLANKLEEVRLLIDAPIIISSGYRCEVLNRAVKGQPSSQHMGGCAADFKVKNIEANMVMQSIFESDIKYDQLILEYDRWVHISVPNFPDAKCRMEALIINKNGKRRYG